MLQPHLQAWHPVLLSPCSIAFFIMDRLSLALMILLIPIFFLGWLTESYPQRVKRWRGSGATVAKIAVRLNTTPYRVRRYYLST